MTTVIHHYKKSSAIFIPDGTLIIGGDGNVKDAAIAFAKFFLEMYIGYIKEDINGTIEINCKKGEDYTIDWIGISKPEFWEEFKQEFEKFCKLRAFL